MKVKIARKKLLEHKACGVGLAWFNEFKERMGVPRNKVLTIEWDALSMVWSLSNEDSRQWVRWAIDNGILTSWSLAGADLRGADLTGAELTGADLNGAILNGAYYPIGPVPDGWRRTETGHLTSA